MMISIVKQFVVASIALVVLMGGATALDSGVLRGYLEDNERNDLNPRMSVAAAKESARHLLRKWLLKSHEDKAEEKEEEPKIAAKVEPEMMVKDVVEKKTRSYRLPQHISDPTMYKIRPQIFPLTDELMANRRKNIDDARRELVDDFLVAEKYFVPMEEQKLVETFVELSDGVDRGQEVECNATDCTDINTFISITVGSAGARIIYDHWEDGYEPVDGEINGGTNTEFWGDGDCSNGFRPDIGSNVTECQNNPTGDVFEAGDSLVINNVVELNRDPSQIFYDGGDQILSDKPIKIVRGGFAVSTGPLLAGAVEVYRTSFWGTEYVLPVGQDTINAVPGSGTDPFQYTSAYITALEDGTQIFVNGVLDDTINKGETHVINDVLQGQTISSTGPIQVHLLTGENGEPWYENRWYSLLPVSEWQCDYFSPVGVTDDIWETRVWIFNPNDNDITVTVEGQMDLLPPTLVEVPAGDAVRTNFSIPTGSGVRVYTDGDCNETFIALTQTDIEIPDSINTTEDLGQRADWAHTFISAEDATTQATVGVGWGCPAQRINGSVLCEDLGETVTEVVWVTTNEDATIYVDYSGVGDNVDFSVNISRLESFTLTDLVDNDLSGAVIWATESDEALAFENPVPIFLAWGQNPLLSAETRGRKGGDYGSGILGNLLLDPSKDFLTPFKFDDYEQGVANPGDIIEYVHTIRSSAVFEIGSGLIYVCDTLPDELDYVEDTAEWEVVLKNDTILASGPVNASEFFDREGPNGPGVIGGGCFPIPSKIPAKADLLIRYCATVVNTEDFPEQGDSECKEVTNTGELIYDFRREGENFKYDKDTTICRVCKNNSTEIDPGCNATLPDCDAEFGEFGSKCLPKTTASTTADPTTPTTSGSTTADPTTPTTGGPTTTGMMPPPKPPCNPTLCQACLYFCGHPGPDGYTCGGGYQAYLGDNFMIQDGQNGPMTHPPGKACKVHDFCVYCGYVCPAELDDDEKCPVGCETDPDDLVCEGDPTPAPVDPTSG